MSTSQSLPAWKEEVAAKLTEHRSRRKLPPEMQGRLSELEPSFASNSRQPAASRIAARVAERYSKAPSYREMLEQQAASAPARLVDRTAQEGPAIDAPAAQPDCDPSLFEATEAQTPSSASAESFTAEPRARLNRWAEFEPLAASHAPEPATEPDIFTHTAESVTTPQFAEPEAMLFAESEPVIVETEAEPEEDLTRSLLAELASQPVEPAQPLPARIIEFPRELVAARKARPRQELGPVPQLEEEQQSQLRIFEAEPVAATEPEVESATAVDTDVAPPAAPREWNTIRLDEEPAAAPSSFFDALEVTPEQTSLLLDPPIFTANLEDRLMAGIFDACLVGVGFLMFVAAFVAFTPHVPTGRIAIIGAAGALFGLFLLYQYLFLCFAQSTPGMRYAKIALCTFDDENPTRQAMRTRIAAILISALPLGLGFLWSIFDEDRLGWHDRITRTYQRSYRES